MRFKKFLFIPILLFIYIFFVVDFLVSFNPTTFLTGVAPLSDDGQAIGVGTTVTVTVRRPYFFGLVRLPVYTNYIGYIGDYHKAFFYFVGILTVLLVILEVFVEIDLGKGVGKKTETSEWRGRKMKTRGSQIKDLAKAVGLGVVFGLVIYILSADAGVSVGLGLLLMYLEYKLK